MECRLHVSRALEQVQKEDPEQFGHLGVNEEAIDCLEEQHRRRHECLSSLSGATGRADLRPYARRGQVKKDWPVLSRDATGATDGQVSGVWAVL